MAELKENEWQVLDQVFLAAYNKNHSSRFSASTDIEEPATVDRSYTDGLGNVLKVQHTEAVGSPADIKQERIRQDAAAKLVSETKQRLISAGVRNLHISMNVSEPPNNERLRELVAQDLARFILNESKQQKPIWLFRFSELDWETLSSKTRLAISSLEICKTRGLTFGFGWSEYPIKAIGIMDPAQRFRDALTRKQHVQGVSEVVLLVRFDDQPWDEHYLPELCEIANEVKTGFREIWVVKLWSPEQAMCVGPEASLAM